jgi:hypothetical protein
MPLRYRYTPDSQTTQINIFRNFPKRVEKYPALIVTTSGGNADVNFLGDEILYEGIGDNSFGHEADDKTYWYYGGILTLNVSIHICAKSIADLEFLMDRTTLFMRYIFKEKFFQNNLAYNKVGFTPEEETDMDGTTIFKAILNTKLTTGFENRVDNDLIATIKSINLNLGAYDVNQQI